MGLRWTRRILWLIVLAVLVIAPARLATDSPTPAGAAIDTSSAASVDTVAVTAPFTGVSPTLVIGGVVLLLTLAAAAVRGHRTSWRM